MLIDFIAFFEPRNQVSEKKIETDSKRVKKDKTILVMDLK
jgi:hypothetical protein